MTTDPVAVLVASARLGPFDDSGLARLAQVLGSHAGPAIPIADAAVVADTSAAPLSSSTRPVADGTTAEPATVEAVAQVPSPGFEPTVPGPRPRRRSGFFRTRSESLEAPPNPAESNLGGLDLQAPVGTPPLPLALIDGRALDAVLLAAQRRPQPWGEPDIAALVARIAAGQPLLVISRRVVWSAAGAVRLVVDRGEAMASFEADALALRGAFGRVAKGRVG